MFNFTIQYSIVHYGWLSIAELNGRAFDIYKRNAFPYK